MRAEALKSGVPLPVALAFARVESNFRPAAEGDLDWPAKKPDKYRQLVLEERAAHPLARDPSRWHSYGLYQLHAAHHVRENEDPRVLLDPQTNAARALPYLATLLRQSQGDPLEARYLYVGCGRTGKNCSPTVLAPIRAKLASALREFEGVT